MYKYLKREEKERALELFIAISVLFFFKGMYIYN